MTVLDEYSEEKIEDVIAKENIVDTYDDKLSAYLTKLSSQNLSYKDSLKVTSLLHCLTDLREFPTIPSTWWKMHSRCIKRALYFPRKQRKK